MATSGAVLDGAKASQTNSSQSDLPTSGVARDFKAIPASLASISPAIVDLHGSQYAAAFLDDAQLASTEYALWAANSSQVALVPITTTNANTPGVAQGTGNIPQGNLPVGPFTDGANYIGVRDTQERSVGAVLSVLLRVNGNYYLLNGTGVTPPTINLEDDDGDPIPILLINNAFSTVDPDGGYVGLSGAALTALGGGVSQNRGDVVVTSYLVLANQTFWWSKNDSQTTRFAYESKTQKWLPTKGAGIQNVGIITANQSYSLVPPPNNVSVGGYLPGSPTNSDQYSMLRAGANPSALSSTPLAYVPAPGPTQYFGVRVVADNAVGGFQFTGGDLFLTGVVGVSSGSLKLNPTYVAANSGLTLWYSSLRFATNNSGVVGQLLRAVSAPQFIAPIPGPSETPFIRIGSRRYLTALTFRTDALMLAAAAPTDVQVYVSLATGQLRFSANLPKYADPTDPLFNPSYLGEPIVYDGIACCATQQPLRQPTALTLVNGTTITNVSQEDDLYLPIANPFGANGLGTSGIFYLPDGTGSTPGAGIPPVRPGGDNLADANIGLIRRIGARVNGFSLGDDAVYWYGGAVPTTRAVGYQDDLPFFGFSVERDEALITEGASTDAGASSRSKVALNSDLQEGITGPVYYLNALLTPASYTRDAKLVSRIRTKFTVSAARTESLYFKVNGDTFHWTAALLPVGTSFTADEMATSLLAAPRVPGPGTLGSLHPGAAYADRGYLVLQGSTYVGIGFGGAALDLSGCRVTGFLPGWQATANQDNWYNDSGISFGLARSPLNLGRSSPTPDYIDRARSDNRVLTDAVSAFPYVNTDYAPLRDVVGYGEDVFFRRIAVVNGSPIQYDLNQLVDVIYDFNLNRFGWLEATGVEATVIQPLTELPLGNTNVIPETMLGVEPNPTGGLAVAENNGTYVQRTLGTDYLLPSDGVPGSAILIDRFTGLASNGYRGQWTAGSQTFTDPLANFTGVSAGYLLRVYPSGEASQTYTVTNVTLPSTLTVSPAFESSGNPASWELFEGLPTSVYDRAVLADAAYISFNPLPSQTFEVSLMSPLGISPSSVAQQVANRLVAVVADALANGRAINLRFGKEGTSTATLTLLGQQELGVIANGSLVLNGVGSVRYTTQSFSVLVGDTLFTHTSLVNPLTPVAAFSPNPTGVEYLTSTGDLKFNSTLISNYGGSAVYQVEEFLPATSLPTGQAEFKVDGTLNISEGDFSTDTSKPTVYFEEALIIGTDMTVSPMSGGFYLNKPLRPYQLVKAHYWRASPSGELAVSARGEPVEVTEFLPFTVSQQTATRVTSQSYSFNPPDANGFIRTIRKTIEPTVYVGPNLQNYGQETTVTFDYDKQLLLLATPVEDPALPVRITYAVDESFGGERTFSVSSSSVFQPPFFLPAGASSFKLAGDASNRLTPGQMMRLGASTFYIKSVSYNNRENATPSFDAPWLAYPNATGVTTVEIYPPTVANIGSRNPAQQALTLITARPITASVDGTPTTGPAGFFLNVPTTYEPVSIGTTNIVFQGPVSFTVNAPYVRVVAGMILEIGGDPYTVADSALSQDGTQQSVSVTSPFEYFYSVAQGDAVRISARPVYPVGAKNFLPVGPIVSSQAIELIRIPEGQPGKTLLPGVEWSVNTSGGVIQLLNTVQGLQSGERLALRWTAQRSLAALYSNGILQVPRYSAVYRYLASPSEENGLLGSSIQASFSFRYPDSFFTRDLPLAEYLGEFAQGVVNQTQQSSGLSFGPVFTSSTLSNAGNGQYSLLSQRQSLLNLDRASRAYLAFFNDTIVGFEQVLEAIDGEIVGDRDGKFRFYTRDAEFLPTPGLTDPITGALTTRNVYSEVWNSAGSTYLPLLTGDRLVDPYGTFTLTNGVLEGDLPNASVLSTLIQRQAILIRNDIDDLVLIKPRGAKFELLFTLYAKGSYERLADPNPFSRLFPEQTQGVMVTLPGLDANLAVGQKGEYSFANFDNLVEEGVRSTFLTQIAQVSNPVLGDITRLTSISVEIRTPRAWVWQFYPNGIPANALYTGQAAITVPCALCTVIPAGQVPTNPDTGYPDLDQFAFRGGPLPDLSTGEDLIQNPYWYNQTFGFFATPMQLEGGTPDGRSQALTAPTPFPGGDPGGLYVYNVQHGSVVTFADRLGSQITSQYSLLSIGQGFYAPRQGDSLRVRVRPDATNEDLYQTLVHKDNYDLYTQFSSGGIFDLTAPFIIGQTPAVPVEFLQARVSFTNTNTSPTPFPALAGGPLLDNGDRSFPFIATSNTELDRFGQIGDAVPALILAQGPLGGYVYPDEILMSDGVVQPAFAGGDPPDTLLTAEVLNPVGIGEGPLSLHDLVLVQTTTGNPTLPASSLGFQTVGDYSVLGGGKIEVPRFLSRTRKGAGLRYSIENYMVSTAATLDIIEDRSGIPPNGAAGKFVTLFNLGVLGGTNVLDDGVNAGAGLANAGGLNTFIAASAGNSVRLRIFTLNANTEAGTLYDVGDIVEDILFTSAGAVVLVAGVLVAGTPQFGFSNNNLLIRFLPTPFAPAGTLLDLPALQALPSNRFGPIGNIGLVYSTNQNFGYSLSVSAVNPVNSLTASLKPDRLTFAEVLDFRLAQVRGTVHPDGGWDLQTKLLIEEVEAIDTIGGLHWISYLYLNGKTGADGCPFTFLDRDGTNIIGTFTPATGSGAGDEEGTLKVMAWEGVKPVGAGAVLVANVVAGQVTSITISNGGSGYFGGYVELTIASPVAPGRTATATATVVGGVITNTTIYLNGNGYAGPTAAVTVQHFAGNQQMALTTDIIASAIPSSAQDTLGNISLGTATIDVEPILLGPSADFTRVQSGDIVTVRYAEDPTYEATAAGGSYLVRHIVPPSAIGSPFVEFDSTATAGQQNQPAWVEMDFSTVVSWDSATFEVTLDTVGRFGGIEILDGTENVANTTLTTAEAHGYKVGETVRIGGAVTIPPINGTWTVLAVPSPEQMTINAPIGPAGFAYGGRILESAEPMPPHLWQGVADFGGFPNPTVYLAKFGSRPRLYFVTSASGITSTAVSIEYQGAGSDPNTNLFRVVSGTARDTLGAALSDADFFAALSVGQTVSGRVYFPLTVNRLAGMPDDNVVGYTPTGQYGFRHIRFQTGPINLANYPVGTLTAVTPYAGYVMPNVGDIGLAVCIKKDSDRFILRRQLAVYNNVLALLDLSGVANNHAGQLSGVGRPHANAGVACLVPKDNAITSNGGADPLRLTAGIFCEPSFPVSSLPVVGGPWVGFITAVSATNPAVVTLSAPHNLRVGDQIAIGGTARAGLNTTWTVAATPAGNQFTVAFDNTAGALGLGGDTWGVDQPRLVDNLTSPVWLNTVGLRYAGFSQFVHYNVRRIRRFHEANDNVFAPFAALRFAYETRRGIVTGYTATSKQTATLSAQNFVFPATDPDYLSGSVYTGTQLGGFANSDVNIKAGDVFRLIDPTLPPSQKVIATATIKSVLSNGTLELDVPALGLPSGTVIGKQFEVWLRNAVVPHQQSCDQLLDLVTERTLVDRTVNRTVPGPTFRKGGYVEVPYGVNRLADYVNEANKLRDDLLPVLGESFSDYGLQLGDIVLVDPQGVVGSRGSTIERGVRPFGDISIIERGAPAYVAGQPAPVDDNRGFYRITKLDLTNNILTVDGTTGFGGATDAAPVTYPKSVPAKAARGYAVYPTVHNSVVTTTGGEGQVPLRPTSLPGVDDNNVPTVFPNSYADCNYSVRPFAYRIIRPTGLLSRNAIDLILTMRERMLSLIEQFKLAMTSYGGDYYIFQRDLYGRDLGLPTTPSGYGVFGNLALRDLLGQLDTVPFTNDSDCLSVLDRRFWILDTRLDRLTTDGTGFGMTVTPPGTPYSGFNAKPTGDVRPVLPDRVADVLDYRDRLRAQRFSWIAYRTNRESGTLANIARFDAQFARARQQQLEAMNQRRSLT